jgi:hypothetical protein
MGGSSYSDSAARSVYRNRSSLVDDIGVGAAKAKVFRSNSATAVKDHKMDPASIKVRESRDSDAHPRSNAIAILFDVTGSMGDIPVHFALDKDKLPSLMRLLIEHAYIEDPQIMFGAIGDGFSDEAPLQLGQFESGLEMDDWLTKLYIEGNGGGQRCESYEMAAWWASQHVAMDCLEKRGKKGYLFTMGDEMAYAKLPKAIVKQCLGDDIESDLTFADIKAAVEEKFEWFHIYIEQGSYPDGRYGEEHKAFWRKHLGERLLVLNDTKNVAELIGSTIGVCEGRGLDEVADHLAKSGLDHASTVALTQAIVPYAKGAGRDLTKAGKATGDLPAVSGGGSTRI